MKKIFLTLTVAITLLSCGKEDCSILAYRDYGEQTESINFNFDWDEEDTVQEINCSLLETRQSDKYGDFVWREYRGK